MINFTSFLNIYKKNGDRIVVNPNEVAKISSTDNKNSKISYTNGETDTFEISIENLGKKLNEARLSPMNIDANEESDLLSETPFNIEL